MTALARDLARRIAQFTAEARNGPAAAVRKLRKEP